MYCSKCNRDSFVFVVGLGLVLSGASLLITRAIYAQTPGSKTILIRPEGLPKPYTTPSADNGPAIVPKPDGAALSLPPGFSAEVFAEGFDNPRWLTVAPNGDVFVVESRPGRVTLLRDTHGDGKADVHQTFAEGLRQPFGIAIYKDGLYVGNTDSVVRFSYKDGQKEAVGKPDVIVPDLPALGYHGHWTRNVVFNPRRGKMYVTVGSEADFGEAKPKRAVILEYNADGTGYKVYAEGLRNPVGLAFQPGAGTLWAAVNERDNLGDDLPPDYFTSVKEGGFYGWPYYYSGANRDPRAPEMPDLKARLIAPDVLLQAHSAALGLVFYTAKQFPKEYQGDAFIAFHGSANRSKRTGYKIVHVPFKNGKPIGGYQDFLTGWMLGEETKQVWGRPVGMAVAKDGSLLIVDDGGNKIWRVSYHKP
jgi:glucose/arabinose dehydrogenase